MTEGARPYPGVGVQDAETKIPLPGSLLSGLSPGMTVVHLGTLNVLGFQMES